MEKHPLHLKDSELQKSEEVSRAVEKQERLDGESVPNDPAPRIEAYMDRLENVFINPDEKVRERNLELFRDKIYDELLVKPENFPESYFELQQRIARERGQPVEVIPQNTREQMISTAIEDQRASLDAWIDYLTSDDAVYPTWFKYFVWKNVIKLSQFDKERGEFKKRTASTVAPFPDIYREPLAQIADTYLKVKEDNKNLKDEEVEVIFSKKFPTIYAELIQKTLESQVESNEEIKGEWVKYSQGNMQDAEKLFHSLENKGTGWCTAGRSTAKAQVESGDFYVYYTYNQNNEPTEPRIAIRMQDSHIAEVRGKLPQQNLEPIMEPILSGKLKEFGGEAESYQKKSEDMKRLTQIVEKSQKSEPLTKDDLTFLYEIDSKIEGFGYDRDPRIQELQSQRNIKEDLPILLDCSPQNIAEGEEEVTETTKAYVGKLFPNIFKTKIEHIYTSFPEGKVQKYHIEIGIKTKEQYENELKKQSIYISSYAQNLLDSPDFLTLKTKEDALLVRLTVEGLGFPAGASTEEIYKKAEEFGLELCPPEVGPELRLSYSGGDWMYIAMKQIEDRDGYPDVFRLFRDGDELELSAYIAKPTRRWYADYHFVFRLRNVA